MSGTVHFQRDGAVAVLVIDNPPVNAGSSDIRKALLSCLVRVEADPALVAAVLIGAGKTFIAGSDLREFDLPLAPPQLPEVIAAIEGASKPCVAALSGAALGGGYELALGCDARIAAPGTVVGLPECGLGIIPGAGGTQKLPRLVGRAAAIPMITAGRRVPADEALALGMIDALSTGDLRAEAVALALSLAGTKTRVIDRAPPDEDEAAIAASATRAAAAGRQRPHILAAIRHIRAVGTIPAAQGLAAERADFQQLRVAPEARALRHIFFAEREAARGALPEGATPAAFSRFGILGAGTMGAGIALACLQRGFATTLIDTDAAAIARARARIEADLARSVTAGRMTAAQAQAALAGLVLGTDVAGLADCDMIVEAVIEDLAVKQQVFAALSAVARPDALLATNTSYLDIDAIASAVTGPGRFLGLHFFSPANVMKLLEVVGGAATTPGALATGLAVARALGKQPVQAGNAFGFIGNRIYAAYRAACEFLLEDGALPQDVDRALTDFGFAMGPFAVADLSGLDIAWRMRQQQAATRPAGARYVHIPDRLCEAGRFGRKTGAGYYRYDDAGKPQPDPAVEAIILEAAADKGIARRPLSPDEIVRRALAALVNEAMLVVQQGVAARPGDVDVVMVNGYGFPRWTGGPLHWARSQDQAQLLADCRAFVSASGAGRALADPGALAGDTP